jgi:hypothetical protein
MRKLLDARKHTITQQARTKVMPDGGTETILEGLRLLSPPDLPTEWALLIGDFASNARAALDHLAWHLALRNKWRERRARNSGREWPPTNTEFPIYVSVKDPGHRRSLKTKLSYFRPTDRKAIAAEQPYGRGKLAEAEPLWLLHCIRNTDVHRELHTVLASVPAAAVGEFYRSVPSPEGGTEFYLPQQLRKALAPLTTSANPGDTIETTLKIQAQFSPYVAFDQPGAVFHGLEVLPLLRSCRDEVDRILSLF